MYKRQISRRSFARVLAGMLAFVPAARSLNALAAYRDFGVNSQIGAPPIMSKEQFDEMIKSRIAQGDVLALEGNSIWIKDRYSPRLRLVITDKSIVWKGKYNKGANFQSYPHVIERGDQVVARGQRNGDEFVVEKMYANIVNTYITVDEINLQQDEAQISYIDASKGKGVVRVRADYLVNQALYKNVLSNRQQLRGKKLQIIGLPLKDATIIAANVLPT